MKMEKTFEHEPVFAIGGRSWKARGRLTAAGFVIFAGSTVNEVTESFRKDFYYPMRASLEEKGVIVGGTVTQDYAFRSAAQAGSVVAGRAIATNTEWVTDDGLGNTWGAVHPRNNASAHDFGKASKKARKASDVTTPKEGHSTDGDGVAIYFRTNADGSTVERRGRCW